MMTLIMAVKTTYCMAIKLINFENSGFCVCTSPALVILHILYNVGKCVPIL